MQQQQQAAPQPATPDIKESAAEARPKRVAQALDRLSQAYRLIADIRLGSDRLLEALLMSAQPHQSTKPLHLIVKSEASMRQFLLELRSIGRQLVLNDSLRNRSDSWGLRMPLVCPDGAVVAYAWKRQLAGQAGASAVDRTRLALKAFTDQKRRFFPHLYDVRETESVVKKHCVYQPFTSGQAEELSNMGTVSDILSCLRKEVPDVKTFTHQRLDWLKRAAMLPTVSNETSKEPSAEHDCHSSDLRQEMTKDDDGSDKIAVVEFYPSLLRAVISLHPAGSVNPDAVAFFSPDEGGSYVHARGFSVYHVFRHITEHAAMALQHFTGINAETTLLSLLQWICSYQTLFTKVCSKCGRLLSMDNQSSLFLPPVQRPYRNFSSIIVQPSEQTSMSKDQHVDSIQAYHVGCSSEEV